EFLCESWIDGRSSATARGSATHPARGAAESREPRLHLPRRMRTSIMQRCDFDVFNLSPAVRPLVLDAEIRKLDAFIKLWQLVIECPFTNLFARSGRSAVAVRPVAVPLLEEPLVLSL